MQRTRYLELYAADAGEHLRLLMRGILGMEAGEAGAIEEAFRAAHTLKGLAASMGHHHVSVLAHALEDRLSEVREGGRSADAGFVDELLRAHDVLRDAVEAAIRADTPPDPAAAGADPGEPLRSVRASAPAPPPDAVLTATVRFDPNTPLLAARALLARRNAERVGGVVGAWPEVGVDADEMHLYLRDGADPAAIENAVRAAGAVLDVRVTPAARKRPDTGPAAAAVEEAPSALLRVPRDRLDELAEGVAELSVLYERTRTGSAETWTSDRAGTVLAELQRVVLDLRMVPVGSVFERFGRVVRDAARTADKEVDFRLEGADIGLDQTILDAIADPLLHLLRNAVDHGIESGDSREAAGKPRRATIRLEARRERNSVRITVSDDGRGVDRQRVLSRARERGVIGDSDAVATDDDLFRILCQPGFSTAAAVTELSGRGVGLDVVANRVRRIGGAIEMGTTAGAGTTFTIRLPVTLALAHALRIRVGGEDYAIPLTHVSEAVSLDARTLRRGDGRETVQVRGEGVPLVRLGDVLGTGRGAESAAVVAELGDRRIALAVDELVGHEQIVVKAFDAAIGTLPVFSGATLLADGRPALLIDPLSVA